MKSVLKKVHVAVGLMKLGMNYVSQHPDTEIKA